MSSRPRRTARAVAGVVLLAAAAAACSGSDGSSDSGPGDPAGSSATDTPVVTDVAFGKITGALPGAAKAELSDQVQEVVDGWFDAAYLGDGGGGGDSWPGFTQGAAADARADGDLMSNAGLPAGTEVEATRRAVKIDVLAVKKRPVGVTAHVTLKFVTSQDEQQVTRIGGRLYLTPGKDGWRVFGFDVTKAAV
ncbi:hypothetical protein ABLE68_01100 [Nocardioides sp. CN2-186]|uniref:hypothetical protein n=1 Tax=Nocardioides tweenelious TaxID=3156607 RepID=UPI0032B321D3